MLDIQPGDFVKAHWPWCRKECKGPHDWWMIDGEYWQLMNAKTGKPVGNQSYKVKKDEPHVYERIRDVPVKPEPQKPEPDGVLLTKVELADICDRATTQILRADVEIARTQVLKVADWLEGKAHIAQKIHDTTGNKIALEVAWQFRAAAAQLRKQAGR